MKNGSPDCLAWFRYLFATVISGSSTRTKSAFWVRLVREKIRMHGRQARLHPTNVPALKWTFAAIAVVLVLVSSALGARYQVLHPVLDRPAWNPNAPSVADSAGNLYGTARMAAPTSMAFSWSCRSPATTGRRPILQSFTGSDGAQSHGGQMLDPQGVHGTTKYGGRARVIMAWVAV